MKKIKSLIVIIVFGTIFMGTSFGQSTSIWGDNLTRIVKVNCDGVSDAISINYERHTVLHKNNEGRQIWSKFQKHSLEAVSLITDEKFKFNAHEKRDLPAIPATKIFTERINLIGDMGSHYHITITTTWEYNPFKRTIVIEATCL